MIRYTLKCENDHRFESWFKSAEAFDTLSAQRLTGCPECGATRIEKVLMAPSVSTARRSPEEVETTALEPASDTVANTNDAEVVEAIKRLKNHIEKNSDYVGREFAREARAMHEGETPHRAIHGEANREEVRALAEDGISALPLPFIPRQKTN